MQQTKKAIPTCIIQARVVLFCHIKCINIQVMGQLCFLIQFRCVRIHIFVQTFCMNVYPHNITVHYHFALNCSVQHQQQFTLQFSTEVKSVQLVLNLLVRVLFKWSGWLLWSIRSILAQPHPVIQTLQSVDVHIREIRSRMKPLP